MVDVLPGFKENCRIGPLRVLQLCPALRTEIPGTFVALRQIIVFFLIEKAPNENRPNDLIQLFIAFRTRELRHSPFSFQDFSAGRITNFSPE
jgi:hypothetical protein